MISFLLLTWVLLSFSGCFRYKVRLFEIFLSEIRLYCYKLLSELFLLYAIGFRSWCFHLSVDIFYLFFDFFSDWFLTSILFSLHVFVYVCVCVCVCFPSFFADIWFLISQVLWLEKMLDIISIFSNLLRLTLWPSKDPGECYMCT